MAEPREVELRDTEGTLIASATVSIGSDGGGVCAALHIEPGHLPPDTRARLIDTLLHQPEVDPGAALTVVVPAGDGELIEALHRRTAETASRRVGATTVIEGQLPPEQDLISHR